MRIAIVELYCGESGQIGFYNSQEIGLARAYAKLGHDVLIIYPDRDICEQKICKLEKNIEILYVPAKVLGVHSFYNLDVLLEYGIQLVHLDADNQIYAPNVMKYCEMHGIMIYNYVGTLFSDSDRYLKKAVMEAFSRRNIRYFKKYQTFVKTEYVQQQLLKSGGVKAKIVPVGLDLEIIPQISESKESIRGRLSIPEDKKVMLFVGRLEEYKRPLDAVSLLSRLNESYYMIIVGKGSLQKSLLSMAERLHVKDRLSYIDGIPNIEIHQYYKAADCFVNFNEKEIYGMSILEAMYQRCPVVARHAPGPDSIIEDGRTGYLCGSLNEMAVRIGQVQDKMGEEARQKVLDKFSWKTAAKAFLV